jgi:hypothetical protein
VPAHEEDRTASLKVPPRIFLRQLFPLRPKNRVEATIALKPDC